jgi:hypothetical protein
MNLARGTRIDIKRDAKPFKGVLDDIVVAIHYLLGGDSLFASSDSDRHSMLIATSYKEYVFALEAQVAHVDVGWDIYARQVPDMYWAVGIRQGCGYKCSLK